MSAFPNFSPTRWLRQFRADRQRLADKHNRMPWTARRLNDIISGGHDVTHYLEIGVCGGETFRDVTAPIKWGVDPHPRFPMKDLRDGMRFFRQKSDVFFRTLDSGVVFDLVLVDGLHEAGQTLRDVMNSFAHSNASTVMLIDDVIPDDDNSGLPDLSEARRLKRAAGIKDDRWQGDVWKLLPFFTEFVPNVSVVLLQGNNQEVDNVQALVWANTWPVSFPPNQTVDQFLASMKTEPFSAYRSRLPEVFVSVSEDEGITLMRDFFAKDAKESGKTS